MNRRQIIAGMAATVAAPTSPILSAASNPIASAARPLESLKIELGFLGPMLDELVQSTIDRVCVTKIARSYVEHQLDRDDIFEPATDGSTALAGSIA